MLWLLNTWPIMEQTKITTKIIEFQLNDEVLVIVDVHSTENTELTTTEAMTR